MPSLFNIRESTLAKCATSEEQLGPDAAALAIAICRIQENRKISDRDLLPILIRAIAYISQRATKD